MIDFTKNISENLRKIRIMRELSYEALSEATGVSKSMVFQIEKGEANPSINVLARIAEGLDIDVFRLISKPRITGTLVNPSDIAPVEKNPGQYDVRICFEPDEECGTSVVRIDLEPGGTYICGGRELDSISFISVAEGEVDVNVDNLTNTVKKGEIFRFYADKDHTFINYSDKKAELLMFYSV